MEILPQWKMAARQIEDADAIDPRALEHYLAPFRDPPVARDVRDYRAGAYADYEIDKKISTPARRSPSRCWPRGEMPALGAATTPLDTWKKWATNVREAPVDPGIF
jgi:haloacetate dehalogenase